MELSCIQDQIKNKRSTMPKIHQSPSMIHAYAHSHPRKPYREKSMKNIHSGHHLNFRRRLPAHAFPWARSAAVSRGSWRLRSCAASPAVPPLVGEFPRGPRCWIDSFLGRWRRSRMDETHGLLFFLPGDSWLAGGV
jgi:hypothetical protein